MRVAALCSVISHDLGVSADSAVRAAELAKCDLLTGMVGEFPELQGVMGGYYARLDGETEAVSGAIEEQYLPKFAGDIVPPSAAGQIGRLQIDRALNDVSQFKFEPALKHNSDDPERRATKPEGILAAARLLAESKNAGKRIQLVGKCQNLPGSRRRHNVARELWQILFFDGVGQQAYLKCACWPPPGWPTQPVARTTERPLCVDRNQGGAHRQRCWHAKLRRKFPT